MISCRNVTLCPIYWSSGLILFDSVVLLAEVWGPNIDKVLEGKINGLGKGSKNVCAVADMEG
jgi:hypothetical protein